MTFGESVLALLSAGEDGLRFDDPAVDRLLRLLEPLEDAALFDAARDLLRLAHFLDVEKQAPTASGTLLTLVLALAPALRAIDGGRAAQLVDEAEGAAERLRAFRGDERVAKVLDSGARPAGTTPAGPLARFTVAKKP